MVMASIIIRCQQNVPTFHGEVTVGNGEFTKFTSTISIRKIIRLANYARVY